MDSNPQIDANHGFKAATRRLKEAQIDLYRHSASRFSFRDEGWQLNYWPASGKAAWQFTIGGGARPHINVDIPHAFDSLVQRLLDWRVKNPPKVHVYEEDEPREEKVELSEDQAYAIDQVLYSPHRFFFLSGEAGTGKSYVVKQLKKRLKAKVTASTGLSASLVGGCTLHSFMRISPNNTVPSTADMEKRLADRDLLIIEEVSMVSAEILDMLFWALDLIKWEGKVLFVGDFMQLKPVEGNWAFSHPRWAAEVHMLWLSTMHRQSDMDFCSVLSDLRYAQLTPRLYELVQARTVNALPDDCTHLVPLRRMADATNSRRLSLLPGKEWTFHGTVEPRVKKLNDWELEDALEKKVRFPKTLSVKVGARVVLLTNDPEGRWVNGTTGHVKDVSGSAIVVETDNKRVVYVEKAAEEVQYGGGILFVYHQYPMLLAWALTIHKAQGMTMDRVGVQLERHFDCGMTYVAFSRARTKEGLHLAGKLEQPMVSYEALNYLSWAYHRMKQEQQKEEECQSLPTLTGPSGPKTP